MNIITVTTGPGSKKVAELATVKTELGISGSSEDTKLNRLIAGVSALIAGPDGLNREPWRQTYEEKLPGRGGIYLRLSRWPIESISQIDEGDTTLNAADYSIVPPERSEIYRSDGWQVTEVNLPIGAAGSGDHDLDYTVDYIAGWLMPEEIETWQASTAYGGSGEKKWVLSTSAIDLLLFEATTAGTSGGSEPTWPTTAGQTVVDSGVTWTARDAREMPEDLQEAALMQIIDWYRGGLQIPTGIKSERHEGHAIEYLAEASAVSRSFIAMVRCYL